MASLKDLTDRLQNLFNQGGHALHNAIAPVQRATYNFGTNGLNMAHQMINHVQRQPIRIAQQAPQQLQQAGNFFKPIPQALMRGSFGPQSTFHTLGQGVEAVGAIAANMTQPSELKQYRKMDFGQKLTQSSNAMMAFPPAGAAMKVPSIAKAVIGGVVGGVIGTGQSYAAQDPKKRNIAQAVFNPNTALMMGIGAVTGGKGDVNIKAYTKEVKMGNFEKAQAVIDKLPSSNPAKARMQTHLNSVKPQSPPLEGVGSQAISEGLGSKVRFSGVKIGEKQNINIAELNIKGRPRAPENKEQTQSYIDKIKKGQSLGNIVLGVSGHVHDGNHRIRALINSGIQNIELTKIKEPYPEYSVKGKLYGESTYSIKVPKDFYNQSKGVASIGKGNIKISQVPQGKGNTEAGVLPSANVESTTGRSLNNQSPLTYRESLSHPQTKAEANRDISQWEAAVQKDNVTLKQANAGREKAFNQTFKEASQGTPAYKKGKIGETVTSFPAKALSSTAVKDKNPFSYQRETLLRNIEDTFKDPKDKQAVKQYFHDPILKNETANVQFQNDLRKQVEQTVPVKRGSKQDFAAADLVEGTKTLDQIKTEFPKDWQSIVKASESGRAIYKELLGKINAELGKFGYTPIPERQNYVTHTRQIQTLTERFGNMINFTKDKLPTEISGINVDTKPGRQFFSFGMQRRGGSTHEGLITALDKYITPAGNQIFHTADIQRGRALEQFLNKANEGSQSTTLSNFNSYLNQYVGSLAGKQNIIDRPIEKVFGRGLLNIGNGLRKRTGANMIGGNISSAITNFIPFTQSMATTSKPAIVKGIYEATLGAGKSIADIDGQTSAFLTRRFPKEQIGVTLGSGTKAAANFMFKMVDGFTSRSIVAGKYFEGLSKGLSKEQAIAQADEYTARVLADRSFGQVPLLFNSKMLGALTQFQVEVNNQVSFFMKDVPKNLGYNKLQVASALTQAAIYSYVFNNLFQSVTGRRPQIDPIHAVIRTLQMSKEGKPVTDMLNPTDQNSPTGEIVQNLPFTSILSGGRIPIGAAMPDVTKLSQGDIWGGLKGPATYLVPPLAGGQINKTITGLQAYGQGYSATDKGNIRFPIEKTPQNAIRSALFGQYANPQAVDYFNEKNTPMSDNQSAMLKQSSNIQSDYSAIRANQQATKIVNEQKAKIKSGQTPTGQTDDSITKLQVQTDGKGRYLANGDYSYKNADGNAATLKISPPTTGQGIDAFTNENWNYTAARAIYKAPISNAEKNTLYKKLGVDPQDTEYDYKASHTTDIKTQYIMSKADTMPHDELINQLLTGRVESVSGTQFAANGVIDNLYNQGVISKEEQVALKKIKTDKNGKSLVKAGTGKGKKMSIKIASAKVAKFKPLKLSKAKAPKYKKPKNTITITKAQHKNPAKFKIAKTKMKFSRHFTLGA